MTVNFDGLKKVDRQNYQSVKRKRGKNVNIKEAIQAIGDQCEYPGNFPCAIVRTPAVLDIVNKIDGPKEVKLNENQQIIVRDVKEDHYAYGHSKLIAIHSAFTSYITGYYRNHINSDEEFIQVLDTLNDWLKELEDE